MLFKLLSLFHRNSTFKWSWNIEQKNSLHANETFSIVSFKSKLFRLIITMVGWSNVMCLNSVANVKIYVLNTVAIVHSDKTLAWWYSQFTLYLSIKLTLWRNTQFVKIVTKKKYEAKAANPNRMYAIRPDPMWARTSYVI